MLKCPPLTPMQEMDILKIRLSLMLFKINLMSPKLLLSTPTNLNPNPIETH